MGIDYMVYTYRIYCGPENMLGPSFAVSTTPSESTECPPQSPNFIINCLESVQLFINKRVLQQTEMRKISDVTHSEIERKTFLSCASLPFSAYLGLFTSALAAFFLPLPFVLFDIIAVACLSQNVIAHYLSSIETDGL